MNPKKLEKIIKESLKEAILDTFCDEELMSEEDKHKLKARRKSLSKKNKKNKLIEEKFEHLKHLIEARKEENELKEFYKGISSKKFKSPDDAISFLLDSEKWKEKQEPISNALKDEIQVKLSENKVRRYEMILYPVEEESKVQKESKNEEKETKKDTEKGI